MQAVQATAAEVIAAAKENRGPREWRPRGTSGENLRRYWSVSSSVGASLGESTQRLSTWLHELGHQVHFWAGEPDLTTYLLTEYGGKDPREAAAEAFSAWMLARETMVSHYPELAKAVQAMIEQATTATTKGGKR